MPRLARLSRQLASQTFACQPVPHPTTLHHASTEMVCVFLGQTHSDTRRCVTAQTRTFPRTEGFASAGQGLHCQHASPYVIHTIVEVHAQFVHKRRRAAGGTATVAATAKPATHTHASPLYPLYTRRRRRGFLVRPVTVVTQHAKVKADRALMAIGVYTVGQTMQQHSHKPAKIRA